MPPPIEPDQCELQTWLERGDRLRRMADLLFGTPREPRDAGSADMSCTLSLAYGAPADIDLDLADPAQRAFGDYELLSRLGRGGMGVVYRARQCSLDRDVALKVLAAGPWAGASFIERLRTEARHAARLAHPHIVSVFDVGQHEEFCYYTMRLIDGESLRERLVLERSLTPVEAVRIALSITRALAYAHGIGVLHLDIKPANILLGIDGEPHLADFGLARPIDLGGAPTTSNTEISGTPHYMAPEQAQPGSHPLSVGTDIFALGATLFEMLAGRPPRDGCRSRDVIRQAGSGTIPRLRDIVEKPNRELDAICARCMALDPAQRYLDANALADDLWRWQQHLPVDAMAAGRVYRARKFLRRNTIASALSGLILLVVVLAMTAMAWQVRQTAREAQRTMQIKDQLIQLFLQPEDHQYGTADKAVSEFLDQGAERLQSLPLGSEVRGELAGVIVGIYVQLGQWQRAATLAEAELGGAPITAETAAHRDLRLVTGWAIANYGLNRVEGLSLPLASAIANSTDTHSKVYLEALVIQSSIAISNGNFSAAVRDGELALSLMRDRPASKIDLAKTHMELSAAYVGIRQPRKGREHSEIALLEIGDEDSVTHMHATTMAGLRRALFGEFEYAQAAFDDGAAQWQRLKMSFPASFESMTYAANAFDLGDLDRSATTIKKAVVEDRAAYPTSIESPEWHWLPGEIALQGGAYLEAAEHFAHGATLAHQAGARFTSFTTYLRALQAVALTHAHHPLDSQRVLEEAQRESSLRPHPDFATSMVLAASALRLSAEKRHREALANFDRALAEIEAARKHPAVLEDQLRENRDALRFRVWKAQAQIAAADIRGARITVSDAHQMGIVSLGANHPFMRELATVERQLRQDP